MNAKQIEVKKVDELTIEVDGKVWSIETLTHSVETNEAELLELSDRGEKLLGENKFYENLIAEARGLGVKTAKELKEEEEDKLTEGE